MVQGISELQEELIAALIRSAGSQLRACSRLLAPTVGSSAFCVQSFAFLNSLTCLVTHNIKEWQLPFSGMCSKAFLCYVVISTFLLYQFKNVTITTQLI